MDIGIAVDLRRPHRAGAARVGNATPGGLARRLDRMRADAARGPYRRRNQAARPSRCPISMIGDCLQISWSCRRRSQSWARAGPFYAFGS
jgi:hypothetical protein